MFLDRGDVKHHLSREDILNRQAWSGKVVDQIEIEVSEFLVSGRSCGVTGYIARPRAGLPPVQRVKGSILRGVPLVKGLNSGTISCLAPQIDSQISDLNGDQELGCFRW